VKMKKEDAYRALKAVRELIQKSGRVYDVTINTVYEHDDCPSRNTQHANKIPTGDMAITIKIRLWSKPQ